MTLFIRLMLSLSVQPAQIVPFDKVVHQTAVIELWAEIFSYGTAHNDPAFAIEKKLSVDDELPSF